jgi:predicted phage terminase large subunit-like protein
MGTAPVATEQRQAEHPGARKDHHKAAEELARRELARRNHLDFIQYTWSHAEPYVVGQHTRLICERIDQAIAAYRAGVSTFLAISIPFRHGKSEIASRALPPHWLGLFPDSQVMLATYSADLANDLSRDARRLTRSETYRRLFPGVAVAEESSAVDRWGVEARAGSMSAVGLGGAMTGRGYQLGIVDDFLKNREEAESATMRQHVWDSFTNDFLTRRAPVSVTIIPNTRWHTNDLIGRIEKAMKEDPAFPRFQIITMPAFDDTYLTGTLFPERFDRTWYEQQRASLGTYGTASLLQCRPVARGGNLLKTALVQIIEPDRIPDGLRFVRFWDPASTVKTAMKPDPDYTAGVKLAVRTIENKEGAKVPQLIIADVRRGRWEAPERERIMIQTAKLDGPGVRIGVEATGGYKDVFTRIKSILGGLAVVDPVYPATDKLVRASPLEPIFEAGNVLVIRGEWTQAYLDELGEFPSGSHDDQVDATSGGYAMVAVVPGVMAKQVRVDKRPVTAGLRELAF